jgi:hypothetical protein
MIAPHTGGNITSPNDLIERQSEHHGYSRIDHPMCSKV